MAEQQHPKYCLILASAIICLILANAVILTPAALHKKDNTTQLGKRAALTAAPHAVKVSHANCQPNFSK